MSEQLKYCLGCMESIPYDVVVCPHCGYNEETVQPALYIEPGTLIMRKYLVGRVIGATPDTVSYIGANVETGLTVDIIEFFPHSIVTRQEGETEITVIPGNESMYTNCRASFLNLWKGLDIFKDATCLPNVVDIVDSNGTLYAVCEHKDCISLRESLENNAPLKWPRALSAFKPVMYALKKLNYAGIIHGALSPDTILVGADKKLHITGFSIPQCNEGLAEFSSKPAEGFAPIELYDTSGAGPMTDVYSITALLYYSITLSAPPEATLRVVKDTTTLPAAVANTLSRGVIDALIKGLSVYPEGRYTNFDELITALTPPSATPTVSYSAPIKEKPVSSTSSDTNRKSMTEKEKVDLEIKQEEEDRKRKKKEKKKKSDSGATVAVGIKSFLAGFILSALLFCGIYGTALYKNYPVDFMDALLKPFSFLPLNGDITTTEPSASLPVPTEPSYITVADFVNDHNYESILSSSFFANNYDFDFKFEESFEHPKGTIISQSIEPGESVEARVRITLVVSEGTTKIKLTDVAGVNYFLAVETLETAGFKVKYNLLTNDGKHKEFEVFSMDKKAGELYETGTVITLNVWGKVVVTTTASTTAASTTQSAAQSTTAKPAQSTTKATTQATTAEATEAE